MLKQEFRGRSFLAFCASVFGTVSKQTHERGLRFVEEAVELGQTVGVTEIEAHALVKRAYSRPVGRQAKEVGQAQLTLEMLGEVLQLDVDECADAEVIRCFGVSNEEWHRRHQAKVDDGLATPLKI